MADLIETRRRFMAHFASVGLGTTLAPGVLWARMQDAGAQKVTLDMVTDALKLAGIEMTEDERKAMVDGANRLRTFWSVVVPLSRNATVTVAVFTFLWAWSDFVFASTVDGGGSLRPITVGIYRYIGNNNQEWNAIMATAVVASIPATVLLVVAQRYVAAGITSGAVKD